MDPTQLKRHIRESIAERLARLNEKDRQAESRSICRRIEEALPPDSGVICAFYPMSNEPDIRPLLRSLLKRECELYLPRAEGKAFAFRRVTTLDSLLIGPFRIPEPPADAVTLERSDVQVVLVPGIAFDHSGNRLGRGNGGYDKWLQQLRAENDTAQVWGIAFESQIVHDVPAEAHDERMDALITARGLARIR